MEICPHCKQTLPPNALRGWRPFSCPRCLEMISARSRNVRVGAVVFWLALGPAVLLIAKGVGRWIPALLLVAVSAGVLALVAIPTLDKIRPPEPVLKKFKPHIAPESAPHLAELTGRLSETSGWSERFEADISFVDDAEIYDDELKGSVLDAAEGLKSAISGTPTTERKKSQWSAPSLGVEDWHKELKSMAKELTRVASSIRGQQNEGG